MAKMQWLWPLLAAGLMVSGCGGESSGGDANGTSSSSFSSSSVSSSSAGTSSSSGTASSLPSQTPSQIEGDYALLAWNDLGMHCVDGEDYGVFSILPPYNNLHVQIKDKNGALVTSGITVTYAALAGANGQANTTSMFDTQNNTKTNFWDYVTALFGTTLADDTGLTGNKTPSTVPHAMTFNATHQWWEAEGIPITPYDDNGAKNFYPRVKVTAKDGSGNVIAEATTVLPTSDEMDCRACHASDSGYDDAKPVSGWVNDGNTLRDYKLNILRLHDEKQPTAVADHAAALSAAGYDYDTAGLEATQAKGTPILCAVCHASNALGTKGMSGVAPLTQAIHAMHATAKDPDSGVELDKVTDRSACYRCHPGEVTQCLRGVMGEAKDANGSAMMDCHSCHGTMAQVGAANRQGWLEEPNCQACHQNAKRYTSALENGMLRTALDTRFATNPDTPDVNLSLYRFSRGHGDLQCEACHGATHAIYPTHEAGDNLLGVSLQGHAGTVSECSACHADVPFTLKGGPHGMHSVGQKWVNDHEAFAEGSTYQCTACHGADYRGAILSAVWSDRNLTAFGDPKNYAKGTAVTCYDCHNGPSGH